MRPGRVGVSREGGRVVVLRGDVARERSLYWIGLDWLVVGVGSTYMLLIASTYC